MYKKCRSAFLYPQQTYSNRRLIVKVEETKYPVRKLVEAFNGGSLRRNIEYQRGAAWKKTQQQVFIDSIFRSYPVPALFLHRLEGSSGLDGSISRSWDVVDGQQRLIALRDFLGNNFELLDSKDDLKLRLPRGVREVAAPWSGRRFSDLSEELQCRLLNQELRVFDIIQVDHLDEIRDLFIRLQSGTALTRQQIRDAWPGLIGPFIESLAGKLDRQPKSEIFSIVDKRGAWSEEDEQDRHVGDRQMCAQLLLIFLERQRDPANIPSVSASHLDALYHQHTDFDDKGPSARLFTNLLVEATRVLRRAREVRNAQEGGTRQKFRRIDVIALMMLLQDVAESQRLNLSTENYEALSRAMAGALPHGAPQGKGTASNHLEDYYAWWRSAVADPVVSVLDGQRAFSDAHKSIIRAAAEGKCSVCGEHVSRADEEFDHFPIPFRNGGPTEPSNGRLVHRWCHPRGPVQV